MSEPKEVITGDIRKPIPPPMRIIMDGSEVMVEAKDYDVLKVEYETLLLESEANAKKAKAWDELHNLITDVDKVPVPYEYFNGLNWVASKMSELMKENAMSDTITEAVETMKKAAQEIDRLRTELWKANQFIESLGEGNFSPEDYDGDTYEAVKGACQKFLKKKEYCLNPFNKDERER